MYIKNHEDHATMQVPVGAYGSVANDGTRIYLPKICHFGKRMILS